MAKMSPKKNENTISKSKKRKSSNISPEKTCKKVKIVQINILFAVKDGESEMKKFNPSTTLQAVVKSFEMSKNVDFEKIAYQTVPLKFFKSSDFKKSLKALNISDRTRLLAEVQT